MGAFFIILRWITGARTRREVPQGTVYFGAAEMVQAWRFCTANGGVAAKPSLAFQSAPHFENIGLPVIRGAYCRLIVDTTHPPLSRSPFPHKGRTLNPPTFINRQNRICFLKQPIHKRQKRSSARFFAKSTYFVLEVSFQKLFS